MSDDGGSPRPRTRRAVSRLDDEIAAARALTALTAAAGPSKKQKKRKERDKGKSKGKDKVKAKEPPPKKKKKVPVYRPLPSIEELGSEVDELELEPDDELLTVRVQWRVLYSTKELDLSAFAQVTKEEDTWTKFKQWYHG